MFQPNFTDPALEQQAELICQGNVACLFDIAATGRVDIGMSTIEQVQTIDEIMLLSQPSEIMKRMKNECCFFHSCL